MGILLGDVEKRDRIKRFEVVQRGQKILVFQLVK